MNLQGIRNITLKGVLYKLIRTIEDLEEKRLFRKFLRNHPQMVCSGPFPGLKYVNPLRGVNYLQNLLALLRASSTL